MKLQDYALVFGVLFLVAGVAVIYWPAALIVLGVILIRGYLRSERKDAGKR